MAQVSNPSKPGITTSRRTASGLLRVNSPTASSPPDASVPTPEETAENPRADDLPDDLDDLRRSIAEEAGEAAEPPAGDEPQP
jgi:hypothetical protein